MKYVKMWADTPFAGTEEIRYLAVPDDTPDEDLNEQNEEMAYDNAENYSYLATGWDEGFETQEDEDDYFDDCLSYSGWHYISKKEYDENEELRG